MKRYTIKVARAISGMTQDQLADKMGVSRQTISHWENNKKRMTRSHLIAFCAVTGMSEEEIFLPEKSA